MKKVNSILTAVDLGGDVSTDAAEVALPVGTVTLLMADAESSTRLWESDSEAMVPATASHDRIVDEAIGRHGGVKPKDQGEGDSFMAAFSRPSDALEAAIEIQSSLSGQDSPIKLRMAIHTGEVQLRDSSNYIGVSVNRTARLRSVGHGGQILVSQVTHDLVADAPPKSASFKELGVHRLKDLSRPEHVFQVLHPDLPGEFPPLRSLDALPNNLPAQRSTFIGRDHELEDLTQLLTKTRLLTLSGSGGAGKTRLALQLGADLMEEFGDGVWFVPLASVTDDDAVVGEIASVLGVGETEAKILPTFIGTKTMMLILDNAEQVITGTSETVSKLLDSCPNLKVVVTSREPLAVEGETTYRVPSLSLPAEGSRVPIDALSGYEAVALFVDRATKARPNFGLDDENAAVVAEICRRLDGIPLAIELAAARVRVLSPSQILQGLSDRFRLLTGSSRTAVPRQQTLRASVEWSYDLLSDTEQIALRRLAVFPAAFDLDAAEAVISSDELPRLEVLEVITHLVDKSLVVAIDEGDATLYSMLETVRQFGVQRLIDAEEEDRVRSRHTQHFVRFSDDAWGWLELGRSIELVFPHKSVIENLEAALEWAIERGEVDSASRLFAWVWWAYSEGRNWLGKYLDGLLELAEPGTIERGRVLAAVSPIASRRWELAPYASEAVETLKNLPQHEAAPYLPSALFGQAMMTMYMDRPNAIGAFKQLRDASDQVGQEYWSIWAEAMTGYVLSLEGSPEEGLPIMKAAVARARESGSELALGWVLFETGLAHMLAGLNEEALPFYEESIPIQRPSARRMRNIMFQWALDHLSVLYMETERFEDARPLLEEALEYSRDYELEFGNYWSVLRNWGDLKLHEGQIDEAIEIQTKVLEGLKGEVSWRGEEAQLPGLVKLASLHVQSGDRVKANELIERALEISREYEPKMNPTGQKPVRMVQLPLNAFVDFNAADLPVRSARLRGFVDAWIESNELRGNAVSARKRQESIDKMTAALGPERVEAELHAGRTLSPEAAVAYALGETSDPVVSALLEAERVEKSLREGSKPEIPWAESLEAVSGTEFTIANAILLLGRAVQRPEDDSADAEDVVHNALRILVEVEDPILIATCFELLAEIAADRESFEESARLCGVALSLRESAEQPALPCSAAKSREALGTEDFERALDEGSKMSIAEATDYATRGRGERKRPTSGWSSLTPTELRVAGLVSEGLTNPQIGEKLFISKRTVQTHLHNIFAKLNVSSRSELSAEVVRRSGPPNSSRE